MIRHVGGMWALWDVCVVVVGRGCEPNHASSACDQLGPGAVVVKSAYEATRVLYLTVCK